MQPQLTHDTLQNMRVTFVGTSDAHPHSDRKQTCLYIEAGGLGHIVDCGDGTSSALYTDESIDWASLRALLLTHLHADHAGGAPIFLHLLYLRAKEHPQWSLCTEGMFSWHLPECEGARKLAAGLSAYHLRAEKFPFPLDIHFYRSNETFPAGALEVKAFPTSHCEESHGFVLTFGNKRLVVSGDLGSPAEIVEPASGADLLVVECAHFHPRELAAAIAKALPRRVVITHMHPLLVQHLKEAGPYFEPLWSEGIVSFAYDGLTIEVD